MKQIKTRFHSTVNGELPKASIALKNAIVAISPLAWV
jgi:hypothetical protein